MSTTHPLASPAAVDSSALSPSPELVVRLQSARGYPSVSVLMSTTPAAAMTPLDRSRLRALGRDAADRLGAELLPQAAALVDEVHRVIDAACTSATARALGIFVSGAASVRVTLPVEVQDRVVVDPTFATRDLVRALHRTPRHVVLVLSEREARLYDGVGGVLRPAATGTFPLRREASVRGRHPDRPQLRETETLGFLRSVDTALGTYRAQHPSPLVLVGPPRVLAALTGVARHLGRLAGTVSGNHISTPLDSLSARIGPAIEEYLRSRQEEALGLLDRRTGEERSVSGIAACWLSARRERPEMLAVEEGLFAPARLSADGDYLHPATDVEHPDVVDDVVDELIETVLHRGGWVALVEDGALAEHDGVALTLRGRY